MQDTLRTGQPRVLDVFDSPSKWYLASALSQARKMQTSTADYLPQLMDGVHPEAIAQAEKEQMQAEKASEITQSLVQHIDQAGSDSTSGAVPEKADQTELQKLIDSMKARKAPEMKHAKMGRIDPIEAAIALLGAAGQPAKFAGNILATPFEAEISAYNYREQMARQEYEDAWKAYQEANDKDQALAVLLERQQAHQDAAQARADAAAQARQAHADLEENRRQGAQAGVEAAINAANAPGEARRNWERFNDPKDYAYNPVKYERMRPEIEAREARLAKEAADKDLKTQESIETSNLSQEWRQMKIAQAKELFPYEKELKALGVDQKQIAIQLSEFKRDVINPLTKTYMQLRNKWFEPSKAADINYKQFLASMSLANYDLHREQFGFQQYSFERRQAEIDQRELVRTLRSEAREIKARMQTLADTYPEILDKNTKAENLSGDKLNSYKEYWQKHNILYGEDGLQKQYDEEKKVLDGLAAQGPPPQQFGTGLQTPPQYNPYAPVQPGGTPGVGTGPIGSGDGTIRPPGGKLPKPKPKGIQLPPGAQRVG